MNRKTPKPAAVPIEKKKKEQKRIESAREEWEKRQKRRRDEAEAASNNATSSTGQKTRGKRRRKVWQTIASGRVGDGNSQGDVIDLRSPSRSPSIELATPQANTRGTFFLTPDTTVPSTSRDPTPEDAISDIAISYLHHLTGSLASGSERNNIQYSTPNSDKTFDGAARQTSEEAVVAHHHSTSTCLTPHASRETSEEAIIIHHHDSVSGSPDPHAARGVSEEAIISYHHNSPTPQATRVTSEEAVIIHHHDSPLPHASPQPSEEAVTAFHHMSVSLSPIPPISREMSEEAVIAHHHSSPTLARSQVVSGDPYGSSVSDIAITETNDHASASTSPSSLTSIKNGRQTISSELADSVTPSEMEIAKTKTFVPTGLSMLNRVNSLLRPFAYPATTPLPSPPFTPKETRSVPCEPFYENPAQDEEDVFMEASVENTAQQWILQASYTLSTPPRNVSTRVQGLDEPLTPSRLGPTWKTETAPQSVIGDEEVDELESDSESGEDEDEVETPRLEQFRLVPKHWYGRSLFQKEPESQKEHDVDMDNSDSNAWAMEYGIDPGQWDDSPAKIPMQVEQADLGIQNSSEFDEGYGTAGEGSSGEDDYGDTEGEDDENDVDGDCGYRVFAGWADLEPTNSAQGNNRHQSTTSPGFSIKSIGSLTPRRPTAFEATTGCRYEQPFSGDRPISASPGSSTGRVSAELESPLTALSHTEGRSVTSGSSPSYLFDSRFHYENINGPPTDTHRESESDPGGNMPKRDQVILALLRAGHVTLAEDVLRGET